MHRSVRNVDSMGENVIFRMIESLLKSNDRPQSVMLFGERRIGKTSLLLEMVDSFAPSAGRVSGIFCDVAGTKIPDEPGSMGQVFFELIVSAIESQPPNRKVLNALGKTSGKASTRTNRLTIDANPRLSLAECAPEDLAEALFHQSNGLIERIALFIDEFDRFVEPMMSKRRLDSKRCCGI